MYCQMVCLDHNVLRLRNQYIARQIVLPGDDAGPLVTTAYCLANHAYSLQGEHTEFSFSLGNKRYTGRSQWRLVDVSTLQADPYSEAVQVLATDLEGNVQIAIRYQIFVDSPTIKKSVTITNLGSTDACLENLDIESFCVEDYETATFSWIYSDYGRRKSIGRFEGCQHDSLVLLHNPDCGCGIAVGNEAPGVLKRTAVFCGKAELVSGLSHSSSPYPFRKWLAPNEAWTAPSVFTLLYDGCYDGQEAISRYVAVYLQKYFGARLFAIKEKPSLVYNTWVPFETNINERLIIELADKAASMGVKEFIIDDGWSENYGDWVVDRLKFPNGLKPVIDYIRSKGMKPGLWVSIATASQGSQVYQAHPEWFVEDLQENAVSLHSPAPGQHTACLSTGWKDYISKTLHRLVADYDLSYLKLDFAVVTSPYLFDPARTGCHSRCHLSHRDWQESLYANYDALWEIFDTLHSRHPQLFIDCTFEAMGGLQLIDYAMLRHAEGNWLSNFSGTMGAQTDLRLRQMAWWRSPAMPATALLVGNAEMQDVAGVELHLQSLSGVLPIICGDLRQLNAQKVFLCSLYSSWLQSMEQKYAIFSFRQDLAGFGEPQHGCWDGFQRINVQTGLGGIVGVFRHGSVQATCVVSVNGLVPNQMYEVVEMNGTVLNCMPENDLSTVGFSVTLERLYDGKLYEIRTCMA